PLRSSDKPLSYKVLALKYRPTSFDEIVGQTNVTRTLRNALERGKIGHAFLLSGARGVGKTTTARILAKALNCAKAPGPTPSPCSTRTDGERAKACDSCREIADGKSLDVQEIDGASNTGIDSIRELREMARYSPARDRFKIWIIDEVHQISGPAFNALLKTLEEPPPRVKFIFATTEYHKIPETILSRCQQYDFRMIPARELQAHLRHVADEEKIRVSDAALALVARAAEGSVRDSLSLFDQVLAFTGDDVPDADVAGLLGLVDRELLHRASKAIADGDSLAMLDLVESLADYGADYRNFVRELVLHLREILLVKLAPPESPLLHAVLPEELDRLRALAVAFSEEDLLRGLDVLTEAESELRNAPDPRVALDLVLLRLVQLRRLLPFAELVARVERLASGAPPSPRPAAPRTPALFDVPAPSSGSAVPRPASRPEEPPPAPPPPPASRGPGDALLAAMVGLCQGRPSLAAPLRVARAARLEGDKLLVEVPADFLEFARMHADEYRDLARKAAGRSLHLAIAATEVVPAEAPAAAPSAEEERRQKLRGEVEKEPAVQEALDLFDGRVVEVREAKASGEDL
ncbi:MAG TPA: DNA polymerase III subunit gamma/tau, partial [Vicinamibacteria bacterium]|nr:DNA polymerase III subunit gamma/tau [Vicinamibacteria bacterium]